MKPDRRLVLALAFAASFLAVGVPYWRLAYAQASLPDGLLGPGLAVVAVLAAVVRVVGRAGLWRTVRVLGSAVPAAVMARVVYEVLGDPSSHNLWPFELVIAAAVGFPTALAGALVGGLLVTAFGGGEHR